MATLNPYLAYKRDTSHLVYWLIRTSNVIIATSPHLSDEFAAPRSVNTDGRITVAEIVSLSKLIAKHVKPSPQAILSLFKAVLAARTSMFEAFNELASSKPDPEMERSNASHKHFIDALSESFQALAEAGSDGEQPTDSTSSDVVQNQDDLDKILLANRFAALSVEAGADEQNQEQSDNESTEDPRPSQAQRSRKQKRPSTRGRKGKAGKSKKKNLPSAASANQDLKDVPIESYRILQDKDGITTEYYMAVRALAYEWADIRAYLQEVWRETMYGGINIAVPGALLKMAVNIVQRSAAGMFVDYPGQDSFELVINTFTRGKLDETDYVRETLGYFHPSGLHFLEGDVDAREQLMTYSYRDLIDFVTDFQKSRSGKPTKRMMKEIGKWDPDFNLRQASEDEILQWRRCYTINWLFDLVNTYSSFVLQRRHKEGNMKSLDLTDWTLSSIPTKDRCFPGLDDFAGFVTHLAMQKQTSKVSHMILPHHVFQLQCMVDSFTVSRRWSVSPVYGHVLRTPPVQFQPQGDILQFLNTECPSHHRPGIIQGIDSLVDGLKHEERLRRSSGRFKACQSLLQNLSSELTRTLGTSKGLHGVNAPVSALSSTRADGLWEYSPSLCGVGLMEALIDTFRCLSVVLEDLPEALMLLHLHHMLTDIRHLPLTLPPFKNIYFGICHVFRTSIFVRAVPTTMPEEFRRSICPGKEVPYSSDFAGSLKTRLARPRPSKRYPSTLDDIFEWETNYFFSLKSYLMACQTAGWNPDRVESHDIPTDSALNGCRLYETKRFTDPLTGRVRMEETDLVRRMKTELGHSDETIASFQPFRTDQPLTIADLPREAREELQQQTNGVTPSMKHHRSMTGRLLLDQMRRDLEYDVCGKHPLSGINWAVFMLDVLVAFREIEAELSRVRNPLYVHVYEKDPVWRNNKRYGLVYLALQLKDASSLRIMAQVLRKSSSSTRHSYWDLNLASHEEDEARIAKTRDDECSVM
ncbi:hypothetical protein CONLIGDRAFT_638365 [Coniochaeta ligniaria NRRL 30616]|uniref:DUF6604 domain-containing protein n=1 Tax=Coniochaeta ligniaria NRRL 30616 TaxID=1408157 RepID=A0A1J7I4T2_9PEZI|nr:hypothetical protein CONLIGDRAFT_638365 [Coniochaeta ligniaria NRRL 30616]